MTWHHASSIEHRATQLERISAKEAILHFSIILCTYNRRTMVLSTLASLRRQTLPYEQFEVIVVDNNSTDGTLDAVSSYVSAGMHAHRKPEDVWHVRCLQESRNGLAYARNTGLKAATGTIAVFLDDDALADPYLLERLAQAYMETNADAVGARVEIRWEAPRPYWLTDDLCSMLGYFAPSDRRMALPETVSFGSCCFSVKIEALRAVGYFSPLLNRRLHMPTSMEVDDLCQRLHKAGYALWYEPDALVIHRTTNARLKRAFFIGRAYWQGCSQILTQYGAITQASEPYQSHTPSQLRILWSEMLKISQHIFLLRPLLFLANSSTHERLVAAMDQARLWGTIQQRFHLLTRAPVTMPTPAVLFVRPSKHDAQLLVQSLQEQGIRCTAAIADIPLSWLWQHRAYKGHTIGIVHCYSPGAFRLGYWQRQQLLFRLWLTHRLGIRIVATDTGGWWNNTRNTRFIARRSFEQTVLHQSNVVLAHTLQPEKLYPDEKLRHRVYCLPHPGFRGEIYHYLRPVERRQAYAQLGLSAETRFVYLCFAHLHTEQELLYLLEIFAEASSIARNSEEIALPSGAYPLLLAGSPIDKPQTLRLLKLAAFIPAVHLFPNPCETDAALYMGAAHALVIPHFAQPTVGLLETALYAVSHNRVVVAPDLPRFYGMLPRQAHILYDTTSRTSFTHALIKAQTREYHLSRKETLALDAANGWRRYARRVAELYEHLLHNKRTEKETYP